MIAAAMPPESTHEIDFAWKARPPSEKRTGGMAPLIAAATARMSALRRCSLSSMVAGMAAGKFMGVVVSQRGIARPGKSGPETAHLLGVWSRGCPLKATDNGP